MKKLLLLLIPFFIFAYQVKIEKWPKNQTFYGFLKQNKIPFSIYYTLDKKIQKQLARISSNSEIYLLKEGDTIKQALIPFSSEKQLQIIKKDKYITKIVPIQYYTEEKFVNLEVNNFLSYDVYKATKNPYIAKKLVNIFSDRINFRVLPAHTEVEVYYKTKSRFGKIVDVDVIYAKFKNRYYTISAYKFTDGRYYDENGRSLKGMFLPYPMKFKRISSYFGMRYHPILHRKRMHDGIDLVNKIGTPIHSVADGKVIYKCWLGGYGKAVKIKHKNGYVTVYAHMKGFAHIRVGQWIKQGKVIGYMGNTGLSTGPHLHFGVMHNGKWINPLKIKKSAKITLYGKQRKKFKQQVALINEKINNKVAMK
jgi:murein DD-endopeptidase MepM/ murein hydrolase activator NlpD